ncbi:MAG: prepilin-type N-terminal cleavage/methylation domain-containing protein [Verrucomicrobiota bacterium]
MTAAAKLRAFSLVELLVVVAIIGVLSTLGLAATRGVTEKKQSHPLPQ